MVIKGIVINQVGKSPGSPGISRDDLSLSSVVTLTNNDNTGVFSWKWEILAKPSGSVAGLTNPNSSSSQFTPDITGSYLIQLTLNGRTLYTIIAAVKTSFLGLRIPASKETTEFNGWEASVQDILKQLETGIQSVGGGEDRYLVFSDDTQFAETGATFVTKKTFRIIRDSNKPPTKWRFIVSMWVSGPANTAQCQVQAVGTGGTDSVTLTSVTSTGETIVSDNIIISGTNEPQDNFVTINIRLRLSSGSGTAYLKYTDVFAVF